MLYNVGNHHYNVYCRVFESAVEEHSAGFTAFQAALGVVTAFPLMEVTGVHLIDESAGASSRSCFLPQYQHLKCHGNFVGCLTFLARFFLTSNVQNGLVFRHLGSSLLEDMTLCHI